MNSGFAYPYRSLLPRGIENLLVAGWCGSATFLGHAAGKSMGNPMALGQAAGVAAVQCRARDAAPARCVSPAAGAAIDGHPALNRLVGAGLLQPGGSYGWA